MKKSFLLYADQYNLISHLNTAQKGWLLDALFTYVNDSHVPQAPDGECRIIFLVIQQQIDRDADKWRERAERARENGGKGGRPPNNPEEPKKPSGFSGNPEEPRKPVTVTVTDTVTVNVTDTPKTPKGDEAGFEEVWKARWGRGAAANPKQPALKAYAKALKAGASHIDILQAVKLRRGVGKADTEYAPQMVTWLNQERWKDAGAVEAAGMSPAEIAAAQRRANEAKRAHDAQMQELVEAKRRQLGMTT